MSEKEADASLRAQTLCFTGHRCLTAESEAAVARRLDDVLEVCYHQGYRRFISGAARGFDTLAAERVTRLQTRHGDVRLILAIPCARQYRGWPEADCRRYEQMLYCADETRLLSENYYQGCMMVRNRFMVDRSAFCLCYLTQMKGGTASTVAYALKQEIALLNVAMPDACAAFTRG